VNGESIRSLTSTRCEGASGGVSDRVGRRHEVARPQLIAQQSPPRHRGRLRDGPQPMPGRDGCPTDQPQADGQPPARHPSRLDYLEAGERRIHSIPTRCEGASGGVSDRVGRRHEVARPQLIAQQSPPRHRVVSVMARSLCQVAMVVRLTNPRRTVSRQLGTLHALIISNTSVCVPHQRKGNLRLDATMTTRLKWAERGCASPVWPVNHKFVILQLA